MWRLEGVVFAAGAGTLSTEIAASRLLAPYFSQLDGRMANIIGLILVDLSPLRRHELLPFAGPDGLEGGVPHHPSHELRVYRSRERSPRGVHPIAAICGRFLVID
jgi:hypothetical protein